MAHIIKTVGAPEDPPDRDPRSEEANPDGAGRRKVPLTPRHSAGLIAAFETEGKGRMGVEVYYTGQQSLDNNPYRSTSESYFILGFIGERGLDGCVCS